MFLHVSVILFTGEVFGLCPWGLHLGGGVFCLGGLCLGTGVCVRGVSVKGVSVWGGSLSGGSLSWRPPYGNERTVRILLECIIFINFILLNSFN